MMIYMESTTTTCEGYRCGEKATTTRVKDDGTTYRCCSDHAEFYDNHPDRRITPAMRAIIEAEGWAERELEGRVS